MVKFNRQVEYALQLLLALSQKEPSVWLSLKEFSTESTISFLFLQKIAKRLREEGIIEAARGKQGGYRLCKALVDISLKQIIEAIDGPLGVANCYRCTDICERDATCTVKFALLPINAQFNMYLAKTSLADLASAVPKR